MSLREARHFDSPRGWTDEQIAFLKAEWPANRFSGQQIAHRIGKTREVCRRKAYKLDLATKPGPAEWPAEDLALAKQLWSEGLSSSQIGKRLGRSRNAVLGKLHRKGELKKRQPKSSEQKKARARDYQKAWRASRRPPELKYRPLPIPGFTVPESEWVGYFENNGCREIMDTSTKQCCGRPIKYRSYCEGHAGQNYSVKR